MPKKFISSSEIRRHKSSNKDWINCFDAFSQDLTVNGVLAKDELWQKEVLNPENVETIFFYGVNSSEEVFTLRVTTKPIFDDKNKTIISIQYNYQIFLVKTNDNHFRCDETGISYKTSDFKNEYKFPGLLMEILEPFKRWRIKFNGFLFDKNNQKVFVKLRMLWMSNTDVFDYKTNFDTNFLTKQTNGFDLTIDDIFEDRYVGCGQLKGVLQIENNEEEIFLWGSRSKSNKLKTNEEFEQNFNKSIFMAYSEKGIALEVIKIISKQNNKSLHYGWGLASHGTVFPIQEFKVERLSVEKPNPFPNSFKLKINSKYLSADDLSLAENSIYVLSINGHKAVGLLIEDKHLSTQFKPIEPNMKLVEVFKIEESHELVLKFENKSASNESISGGKGSSLSLLKELSQFNDNEFVVPNGFVVTTKAYQMLLRENPDLNKAINDLQSISWSQNREDMQNECQNVMDMFTKIEVPFLVKAAIKDALVDFDKNGNYDDCLVAVRSSACGEDSEDMSAAGQMTSYLGVKGLQNICDSVLKCWSSQFNIIAVEYKRGYGQTINALMAVVVQEMIDCDVAGVMFTCDPIAGEPNKITINANFGIGESVVSASVNPDYISLLVDMESNSLDTKMCIKSIDKITIGAKESAIKINKNSGSGTEVEENESLKDKCCLNEEQILNLGEIGLKIQYYFGSARDIEWGLKDGKYYLFQSRPVTNLNSFNDWELCHELDSGHLDEVEYNTKANLGEVMPGALSPLFLTSIMHTMWLNLSEQYLNLFGYKYNPFRKMAQSITICNYSAFFSLKDASFFDFAPEEHENFFNKAIVLAAFGHTVEDKQLRTDAFERNGAPNFKTKLIKQKNILKAVMVAKKQLDTAIKKYEDLDLLKDRKFDDSKQMFELISKHLFLFGECLDAHLQVSSKSGLHNLILLNIISKGNIDVKSNPNLLTDFANVLSNTGSSIVSADVPTAIYSLAKSIEKPEVFKQMNTEEALDWLENNKDESGKLFKEFIKNFGFRGYKEWDIISKTWVDNKSVLVTTLQNMLPLKLKERENFMTSEQLVARIKTPLSGSQRFLLKRWLLPGVHRAVALREASKSFDIKCIDKFRRFFREMAKMMCYKEGRIPDPDLIFFLTLHELKVLTQFRDPKIVMKAKQRKRIYPKLDKYIYEEMSIGPNIVPKNLVDKSAIKTKYLNGPNSLLTGTPVCTGNVTAKICVARTIEEANNIESGDILVTYCTDIGWSPYLPMISGIITEIGGLVSHGAVIAREYGIPCLVGVDNACQLLSSGETILLDADNSQIVLMRTTDN